MFDTMEFIKAVPSRQGRPGVGERFEPYVRIVRNERWISVFHGMERIAKIPLPAEGEGQADAMNQASTIREKIIVDFHNAVREHNVMVAGRKITEQSARAAEMARQAAALDREYLNITHPPAPTPVVETVTEEAPPPVVETVTEEAPPPVVETVTEEAIAPPAMQPDAPKVAARSMVTRRPVRKITTAKAKPAKAKRNGK